MAIVVRYAMFFEYRKEFIEPALESFVRCIHDTHVKVRTRSWYLFQRFVKLLRGGIGAVAETIMGAMQDLLQIRVVIRVTKEDDDEMSDDSTGEDTTFESQLNLFEAVGSLASTAALQPDR